MNIVSNPVCEKISVVEEQQTTDSENGDRIYNDLLNLSECTARLEDIKNTDEIFAPPPKKKPRLSDDPNDLTNRINSSNTDNTEAVETVEVGQDVQKSTEIVNLTDTSSIAIESPNNEEDSEPKEQQTQDDNNESICKTVLQTSDEISNVKQITEHNVQKPTDDSVNDLSESITNETETDSNIDENLQTNDGNETKEVKIDLKTNEPNIDSQELSSANDQIENEPKNHKESEGAYEINKITNDSDIDDSQVIYEVSSTQEISPNLQTIQLEVPAKDSIDSKERSNNEEDRKESNNEEVCELEMSAEAKKENIDEKSDREETLLHKISTASIENTDIKNNTSNIHEESNHNQSLESNKDESNLFAQTTCNKDEIMEESENCLLAKSVNTENIQDSDQNREDEMIANIADQHEKIGYNVDVNFETKKDNQNDFEREIENKDQSDNDKSSDPDKTEGNQQLELTKDDSIILQQSNEDDVSSNESTDQITNESGQAETNENSVDGRLSQKDPQDNYETIETTISNDVEENVSDYSEISALDDMADSNDFNSSDEETCTNQSDVNKNADNSKLEQENPINETTNSESDTMSQEINSFKENKSVTESNKVETNDNKNSNDCQMFLQQHDIDKCKLNIRANDFEEQNKSASNESNKIETNDNKSSNECQKLPENDPDNCELNIATNDFEEQSKIATNESHEIETNDDKSSTDCQTFQQIDQDNCELNIVTTDIEETNKGAANESNEIETNDNKNSNDCQMFLQQHDPDNCKLNIPANDFEEQNKSASNESNKIETNDNKSSNECQMLPQIDPDNCELNIATNDFEEQSKIATNESHEIETNDDKSSTDCQTFQQIDQDNCEMNIVTTDIEEANKGAANESNEIETNDNKNSTDCETFQEIDQDNCELNIATIDIEEENKNVTNESNEIETNDNNGSNDCQMFQQINQDDCELNRVTNAIGEVNKSAPSESNEIESNDTNNSTDCQTFQQIDQDNCALNLMTNYIEAENKSATHVSNEIDTNGNKGSYVCQMFQQDDQGNCELNILTNDFEEETENAIYESNEIETQDNNSSNDCQTFQQDDLDNCKLNVLTNEFETNETATKEPNVSTTKANEMKQSINTQSKLSMNKPTTSEVEIITLSDSSDEEESNQREVQNVGEISNSEAAPKNLVPDSNEPKRMFQPKLKCCSELYTKRTELFSHLLFERINNEDCNPVYICNECLAEFKSFLEIFQHSKNHSMSYPIEYIYVCGRCSQDYAEFEKLEEHQRNDCRPQENHSRTRGFSDLNTEFDNYCLSTSDDVDIDNFSFIIVSNTFEIPEEEEEQEETAKDPHVIYVDENGFRCDICYDVFDTLNALHDHEQLHEEINACIKTEQDNSLDPSNSTRTSGNNLFRPHMKDNQEIVDISSSLPEDDVSQEDSRLTKQSKADTRELSNCEKFVKKYNALIKPQVQKFLSKSNEGTTTYRVSRDFDDGSNTCTDCDITFNDFDSLKLHKVKAKLLNQCSRCLYFTCRADNLKEHCLKKHNVKYFCSFCLLSFSGENEFKRHERLHLCPRCKKICVNVTQHLINCKAG